MFLKGAQTLQGKDVQTFKSLAKFHDAKNNKKGLKAAEKLLESNPDHPETIAMKALFESGLGEDEKAVETAKVALMKSKMKSLLCWHTYGSLLKNQKDYVESSKCFVQALKLDPENLQILREAANLFIQIRDHSNHVSTRYTILKLKPNMIQHWVSFTLAHHLKGDFNQLFKSLNSLDNLVKGIQMKPQEINQYLLYRVLAFKDAANYEGMYEQLKKNQPKILDKTLWRQQMVFCCDKLNKREELIKNMDLLIQQFPQNLQYLQNYQQYLKCEERQFYKRMNKNFKSKISKIMEISKIHEEQDFKKQFSDFIQSYYQKNIISLYKQIQCIYRSDQHAKWIGEVFAQFQSFLKNGKYPNGNQMNSPSEYLWSLYMLAQHLSRNFSSLPQAHKIICQAIAHTNTVTQLYLIKAEIEYKQHNNIESLKTVNQARKTDLADRYMNNICVKYIMKCQKPDLAEDVLRMFMKDQANLYELQNQWYIIQAGKSFLKARKFGEGLRHMNFIQKQFIDMYGNQYDFHTYCIRKWTLREYVELIGFNDNIYKDKKYIEAAGNVIPYLIEYSNLLKNPKEQPKVQEVKQDQKDKKKAKKKKKQVVSDVQTPLQAFRKKIDYYGKQYLEKIKEDPLKQALTYAINVISCKYVNKFNQRENQLYYKAFSQSINIFVHFNKPLLVIKCVKKMQKTGCRLEDAHLFTLKALIFLERVLKETQDPLKLQFISQFLKEILGKFTIQEFHQNYLSTLKQSSIKHIKVQQFEIVIKKEDKRSQYINLYISELSKFRKNPNIKWDELEQLFYLVHKLQFYGQFSSEMKEDLKKNVGKQTSYFSQWQDAITKLPPSTWSLWWLSEYDQQRQELDFQQKQQETETKQSENSQLKQ